MACYAQLVYGRVAAGMKAGTEPIGWPAPVAGYNCVTFGLPRL
ncbi:MAG: hypothetical protein AVDCRST_MAG93-3484 [uncultured Chloroflexia bacterium]|uniref:Uncharacterized protein n=1 Tax=uncultured Chloroflexia bacterium TaxID=1672391 RepID=A0A6J4JR65_9CHLR|nr:MAG: hypothetical protein AVDCRST_MAG93-3484 [uncultured Chloroflexia bacterium]